MVVSLSGEGDSRLRPNLMNLATAWGLRLEPAPGSLEDPHGPSILSRPSSSTGSDESQEIGEIREIECAVEAGVAFDGRPA